MIKLGPCTETTLFKILILDTMSYDLFTKTKHFFLRRGVCSISVKTSQKEFRQNIKESKPYCWFLISVFVYVQVFFY